jgi:hypothetical protein
MKGRGVNPRSGASCLDSGAVDRFLLCSHGVRSNKPRAEKMAKGLRCPRRIEAREGDDERRCLKGESNNVWDC